MSAVPRYDIVLNKSEGLTLELTYLPGDVAMDWTGYAARMMVKSQPGDGAAWTGFDLTTANGKIVLGEGGSFKARVDESVSLALPANVAKGVYDVLLLPPAGEPFLFIQGAVLVNQGVTR